MPWDYNPNAASGLAGMEVRPMAQRSQRIGSAYEQLIQRFRAQAAGTLDILSLYGDVGSSVPATPAGPTNKVGAGDLNVPGSVATGLPSAALLVDLCTRANELSTAAVTVDSYAASALVAPGSDRWRNAGDTADAVVGDVSAADSSYAQTTATYGGRGAMALSFASGAFGLTRHVIGVEFEIVSKGAIHVGTQRSGVGATWYGEPNPMAFSTTDLRSNLYRLGETFIEYGYNGQRLTQWTPERVRAFASGGTRRLRIGADSTTPGAQVDYVVMRVYSIPERRLAVGLWVPKLGFQNLTAGAGGGFSSNLGGPQGAMRVTNKALTTNVATITTAVDHGRVAGDWINVSIGDATFDGNYAITSVTATTISYAKTAANVASVAVVDGRAWGIPVVVSGADYSLIVRRPVPGGTALPAVTGRLRLLSKPLVLPLNYETRLADTISAGNQPATATAAEDAVLPLTASSTASGLSRGETMPYRQLNPAIAGGELFVPIVAAGTYDVAYVILTADFWTKASATMNLDAGSAPTKQFTLTRADILASPIVGQSVVKLASTGVTKTVTWHCVRLDFGTGIAFAAAATARIWTNAVSPTEDQPLFAGLGFASGGTDHTYPGNSTMPSAVTVDVAEHGTSNLSVEAFRLLGQKPPAPTAPTLAAASAAYAGGAAPYAQVGWTPPAPFTGFGYYEVQRTDDRDPLIWETVAKIADVAATGFADHEARIGVPTGYRIRTVRSSGVEGDWVWPTEEVLTADESSFETSSAGWAAVSGCTVARSTAQAAVGAASLAMTATAAGTSLVSQRRIPCLPNRLYTASAQRRAAVNARQVNISLLFHEAGQPGVLSSASGTQVAETTTGWTLNPLATPILAPPTAGEIALQAFVLAAGVAVGEVHYVDDVHLLQEKRVTLTGERGELYLSANADRTLGVAGCDAASTASRGWEFPEATETVRRLVYGRDLPAAFRPGRRRGVQFTREVVVAVGRCPRPSPHGPGQMDPLLDLAVAPLPYVAVRDTDGNRWLGSVSIPDGVTHRPSGMHAATVEFFETASAAAVATS